MVRWTPDIIKRSVPEYARPAQLFQDEKWQKPFDRSTG
jgi:hypothetical protein